MIDPRGEHPPRVFSFSISESDGGNALRPRTRQTWSADRRAVVRTIAGRARANVPARGAGPVARAAAVSGTHGDRVRARNDRVSSCDLPHISFFRGETMTAYLISLALAGLVAIVLWETFS
ncbi:hypothetical protein ABIE89_008089 [Bradyrhizobium niftali]|uniref:hypothetical protein n=1 Tax=Bradyrhizobium niftali TaxID=2560055 RepID=UPI00383826CD